MIKKETFTVLLGTAVGIAIITILSFFIVWIGFPADTPKESFKDALGFSGGLFGGLTTFGAAIIAAYLFNDWRDQHNKTILANEAKEIFKKLSNSFLLLATYLQSVRGVQGANVTFSINQVRDALDPLIGFNQEVCVDLKYFEDLADLSEITPLINQYNGLISNHLKFINSFFSNPQNSHFSTGFVDACDDFAKEIAPVTHSLKAILHDYILVRKSIK